MKTKFEPAGWFQTALVIGAVVLTIPAINAAGRWATLEAIHQIENPKEVSRPGTHGELGAYQFRETTWRMHSKEPFRRALDRAQSDLVAVRHYEWLKKGLEQAGVPITPYNIALAWNGGLETAVLGRSVAASHDYARRAETLAVVFEQRRNTAVAEPVEGAKPAKPTEVPVFFGKTPMAQQFELNVSSQKPMEVSVVRIEARPLFTIGGNF